MEKRKTGVFGSMKDDDERTSDFKYISPVKVLIWFGFFGTIFTFILSIISSFIKCGYEDSFNYIDSICQIYKKDSNGKTIYYYDNLAMLRYFIIWIDICGIRRSICVIITKCKCCFFW